MDKKQKYELTNGLIANALTAACDAAYRANAIPSDAEMATVMEQGETELAAAVAGGATRVASIVIHLINRGTPENLQVAASVVQAGTPALLDIMLRLGRNELDRMQETPGEFRGAPEKDDCTCPGCRLRRGEITRDVAETLRSQVEGSALDSLLEALAKSGGPHGHH